MVTLTISGMSTLWRAVSSSSRKLAVAVVLPLLATATGCAAATPLDAHAAADFDRPVPKDEPRAELAVLLDLEAASDCEERFDLAVYANRGVDLLAWDERRNSCAARHLRIRYLTSLLSEDALLTLVREHAKSVKKSPQP